MGIERQVHEELSIPYFSSHYESNKKLLELNNPSIYDEYKEVFEEIAAMKQVIVAPKPRFTYGLESNDKSISIGNVSVGVVSTSAYASFTAFITQMRRELQTEPHSILFLYSFERTGVGFLRVRGVRVHVNTMEWEKVKVLP